VEDLALSAYCGSTCTVSNKPGSCIPRHVSCRHGCCFASVPLLLLLLRWLLRPCCCMLAAADTDVNAAAAAAGG
jgi:hypothetical protein